MKKKRILLFVAVVILCLFAAIVWKLWPLYHFFIVCQNNPWLSVTPVAIDLSAEKYNVKDTILFQGFAFALPCIDQRKTKTYSLHEPVYVECPEGISIAIIANLGKGRLEHAKSLYNTEVFGLAQIRTEFEFTRRALYQKPQGISFFSKFRQSIRSLYYLKEKIGLIGGRDLPIFEFGNQLFDGFQFDDVDSLGRCTLLVYPKEKNIVFNIWVVQQRETATNIITQQFVNAFLGSITKE